MKKVFINIKELLMAQNQMPLKLSGREMSKIGRIEDAFLVVDNQVFSGFGGMLDFSISDFDDAEIIDLHNEAIIIPGFVDSHTHTVFAGSREKEFVDKINGLSYEEIAKRGGGILNSAAKLARMSENELFEQSKERVENLMRKGTTALEIKSGYGLSLEAELKMLRVVKRLKETLPLTIKGTFLGAHAFPPEYKDRRDDYVDLVIDEMLPAVAEENLADFVDVFCERGFFSVEQTDRILKAARQYGLIPKIHANQLDFSGGVQVGVANSALSVDHLEYLGHKEIEILKNSDTMPTVLPGCAFFLSLPYSPARQMIDSGLAVAMASDYNPGSSPSGNMKFIMSLACIKYKLLPAEALSAITINTAYAMGISATHGSITPGKFADFIITKPIPSFEYFPYAFGDDLIDKVYVKGNLIE